MHSGDHPGYSITGPILQIKTLLVPAQNNGWPGVAIAVGLLGPAGHGAFVPPGWSGFAYLALTESLMEEAVLIHANVGFALGDGGPSATQHPQPLFTAGIGAQIKLVAGLHAVGEVYHGDPYDLDTAFFAGQLGFRYIFGAHVQIDGTFATSLSPISLDGGPAQLEQWGTLGLRLVTSELW